MRLAVFTPATLATPTCLGGTTSPSLIDFLAPCLGRGESFCRIGTISEAKFACFVVVAFFLEDDFAAGLFAVARSLANCC